MASNPPAAKGPSAAVKLLLMLLKATPFAAVAEQLEQDLADGKIQVNEIAGLVAAAATSADKVFPGEHLEIVLVQDIAVAVDSYAKAKGLENVPTEVPVSEPAVPAKAANGKK